MRAISKEISDTSIQQRYKHSKSSLQSPRALSHKLQSPLQRFYEIFATTDTIDIERITGGVRKRQLSAQSICNGVTRIHAGAL